MADKFTNVIVSTRVRLARNIVEFPFPQKIEKESDAKQIIASVSSNLIKNQDYKLHMLDKMSSKELNSLVERHLISIDAMNNREIAGLVLSVDETISVMINEEDHIRIQSIKKGYDLNGCYDAVDKIDDIISKNNKYAFDDKLGYLTVCPTNLGCGLRASVMMFLPALKMSGKISSVIETATKLNFLFRGIYGEATASLGDMYQVSNQFSFGVAEVDIIRNLNSFINNIVSAELAERKTLFESNKVSIMDKIYRAFGVLKFAVKVSSIEATQLLTLLKLGISLGLFSENSIENFNILSEKIMPNSLISDVSTVLSEDERDVYRADIIKKEFSKLKLEKADLNK